MNSKIFSVGLLIITAVSLTGLSCSLKKKTAEVTTTTNQLTQTTISAQTTTSQEELVTISPDLVLQKSKKNYDISRVKAAAWRADAKLYQVSVKLNRTLDANSFIETYTYGSASDPNYWWTISIDQKTGKFVRAIIPKEDYLGGGLQPINLDQWKIGFVQAFQAAETIGGTTFRQTNSDWQIKITLTQGPPNNWLWWKIEYITTSGTAQQKYLVYALNGQSYDETGKQITAPTANQNQQNSLAPTTTPLNTPTYSSEPSQMSL